MDEVGKGRAPDAPNHRSKQRRIALTASLEVARKLDEINGAIQFEGLPIKVRTRWGKWLPTAIRNHLPDEAPLAVTVPLAWLPRLRAAAGRRGETLPQFIGELIRLAVCDVGLPPVNSCRGAEELMPDAVQAGPGLSRAPQSGLPESVLIKVLAPPALIPAPVVSAVLEADHTYDLPTEERAAPSTREPVIAIPLLVARDSAVRLAKIHCRLPFQGGFLTTQYGALSAVSPVPVRIPASKVILAVWCAPSVLAQLVTAAADSNETLPQFLGALVCRATYDVELTAENYSAIANDIRQANLKLEAGRIAAEDLVQGVERERQYPFAEAVRLIMGTKGETDPLADRETFFDFVDWFMRRSVCRDETAPCVKKGFSGDSILTHRQKFAQWLEARHSIENP